LAWAFVVESICVLQDLDLIWDNAILYNGDQVDIGKTAIELKRLTRQSLKQAGLDLGIGVLHGCNLMCFRYLPREKWPLQPSVES
jgi:hypothetical protein